MATVSIPLVDNVLAQTAVAGDAALPYTASNFRQLIDGLWESAGVLGHAGLRVTQRAAGANWSVDISAGRAVVQGTVAGEKYLASLRAATNVPLTGFTTAPAATRTHKVWLAVYDKNYAGTTYGGRIVVTEDTGGGAPNPPDNPVGYVQLATFTIAPAQASITNANITNVQARASMTPYAYGRMHTTNQTLTMNFDGNADAVIALENPGPVAGMVADPAAGLFRDISVPGMYSISGSVTVNPNGAASMYLAVIVSLAGTRIATQQAFARSPTGDEVTLAVSTVEYLPVGANVHMRLYIATGVGGSNVPLLYGGNTLSGTHPHGSLSLALVAPLAR